jgi:hypothetical protein
MAENKDFTFRSTVPYKIKNSMTIADLQKLGLPVATVSKIPPPLTEAQQRRNRIFDEQRKNGQPYWCPEDSTLSEEMQEISRDILENQTNPLVAKIFGMLDLHELEQFVSEGKLFTRSLNYF